MKDEVKSLRETLLTLLSKTPNPERIAFHQSAVRFKQVHKHCHNVSKKINPNQEALISAINQLSYFHK